MFKAEVNLIQKSRNTSFDKINIQPPLPRDLGPTPDPGIAMAANSCAIEFEYTDYNF